MKYPENCVAPIDVLDVMGICPEEETETQKEARRRKNLNTGLPVEQWTAGYGEMVARFPCLTAAVNATGISRQNIYGVLIGVHNKAGGYAWRYVREKE